MQRQGSFLQAEYARKKRPTWRDKFLAEMEAVVPWARLGAAIGLERMLRIYFVQQWYGLADEAVEDALYDSQALRGFAGIELSRDPMPDATTVLQFCHAGAPRPDPGAIRRRRSDACGRQGTIPAFGRTDVTIIAAPVSTKNKEKARDPEMHQTKKGNQWYFGMPFDKLRSAYRGGCRLRCGPLASPALPPTRLTSTRWRQYCTARRKRSSPMLATPERPSAPNTPSARCGGTLRSSAASSRPCQKRCALWLSRWSGRWAAAGPG